MLTCSTAAHNHQQYVSYHEYDIFVITQVQNKAENKLLSYLLMCPLICKWAIHQLAITSYIAIAR